MLGIKLTGLLLVPAILFIMTDFSKAALICTTKYPEPDSPSHISIIKPNKTDEFYSLVNRVSEEKDQSIRNMLISEVFSCCIACRIKPGTMVIIIDQGIFSHTIRVIEGDNQGCTGDIPTEYVSDCR